MFIPFLVLTGVVVAVVVAVTRGPQRPDVSGAREVLDRRLAAGEISVEEHARRASALPASRSVTGRRMPLLVALGGLALVALLVASMGWGGASGWGWGGMGSHMRWGAGEVRGGADAPVAGASTVVVTATELAFDPSVITIPAGQPVNLTLVNDGRVFHDLTVPALDLQLGAQPGEEVTGSVTVTERGRYELYCSVPGHAQGGMRGTLVVEVAGPS